MGGPHVGWGSEKADLMRISNICQAFRSFSAFQYLAFSITPLVHHSLGTVKVIGRFARSSSGPVPTVSIATSATITKGTYRFIIVEFVNQ